MNGRLTRLSLTPRIYVVDDFASGDEVAHVLARTADRAWLAALGVTTRHDATGVSFEMPIGGDPVLEGLAARACDVIGVANAFGSTMRFRRYAQGESHPPHLDCYTIEPHHLVVTALLYLTDTAEGGETIFPRALPAPIAVAPQRGRLAAWFNYYPNGAPDPLAYHEARTVASGEKATITNFIYNTLACASTRVRAAGE